MQDFDRRPLGALPTDDGFTFRVWTPETSAVELFLASTGERRKLKPAGHGYFELTAEDLAPGTTYRYMLDGGEPLPDPASRYQPEGVHGPSALIDPRTYDWNDDEWNGMDRSDLIFYELHVGTFTESGRFQNVTEKLGYLKELGITAIELMPVADFPGRWNWGYDPAAFFAPSRAYGHPDDLRALVDAAHQQGLAVYLDVIYNHLGPDGAYAAAYAPFFTEKHETPWGQAINLDDEYSAGVRHFFIDNALHWLREYHIDGLRLDATFALVDDSPTHFLAELADAVRGLSDESFKRYLIAEDHRNDRKLLDPRRAGGYGLDGAWSDDFHHQIRNHTAGDRSGYFTDFEETTAADIAETIDQGWFFTGQESAHFGGNRGTDTDGLSLDHFVFYIQNHDQVGNRPHGDRLTESIDLPLYRAASALFLFLPELPLLFQGQEWAASTPFQFFTDHNPELGELVREGRKEEFADFEGFSGDVPDPQDPDTFKRSTLNWEEHDQNPHGGILKLYQDLLHHRKQLSSTSVEVNAVSAHALSLQRGQHHLLVATTGDQTVPLPEEASVVLQTESAAYAEAGQEARLKEGHAHFSSPGAILLRSSSS